MLRTESEARPLLAERYSVLSRRSFLLQPAQNLQNLIVRNEFPGLGRLDIANDTPLIDDEPGAFGAKIEGNPRRIFGHFGIVVEDVIRLRHLASHIAQERIGDADLLSPCFVGVVEVHTHTQHLGIGGLELGEIKLEGQRFLRSGAGEGGDIEEHHDRFLTDVVGEADLLCRCRRQ